MIIIMNFAYLASFQDLEYIDRTVNCEMCVENMILSSQTQPSINYVVIPPDSNTFRLQESASPVMDQKLTNFPGQTIIKPRSRRLGGFLICLRFFFFCFVCNYIQTSADDVIISQLQAISQLFSSYPLSGEFC